MLSVQQIAYLQLRLNLTQTISNTSKLFFPTLLFLPLLFCSLKGKSYIHLWIIFSLPSFPKSSHLLNHKEVLSMYSSCPNIFTSFRWPPFFQVNYCDNFSIILFMSTFYTHSNLSAARFGLFQFCFYYMSFPCIISGKINKSSISPYFLPFKTNCNVCLSRLTFIQLLHCTRYSTWYLVVAQ